MKSLMRILREPLVYILTLSLLVFLVFDVLQKPETDGENNIHVQRGQINQLSAQFERTSLRAPTSDELQALIEDHVKSEVFYREGLALGLDQNDPVVRQRMRMKLEVLLEDLSSQVVPSEAILKKYMNDNKAKFILEAKFSIQQLFIDPNKHADMNKATESLITQLGETSEVQDIGDQTLLPPVFMDISQREISYLFGDEFSEKVASLKTGELSGLLISGYGGHVVLMLDRKEGLLPPFTEAKDKVQREYLAARHQELREQSYQELRKKYEISIEDPKNAPANEDVS